MNKRYRKHGKAVPWINTRFSRPYKRRRMIKRLQACTFLAVKQAEMSAIRHSGRPDAIIGMAKCAIETAQTLPRIMSDDSAP